MSSVMALLASVIGTSVMFGLKVEMGEDILELLT